MTVGTAHLPIDLWIKVLKSSHEENDLPHEWISYRHVCTIFKEAVETIFLEKHLPKTRINFNLGEDMSEENSKIIDTEFVYTSLQEDNPNTAIFSIPEIADEDRPAVLSHLQKSLHPDNAQKNITSPDYTIQIHHDLNDTPLPSLHLDPTTLSLSFNWKEAFTLFYAEELLYQKGLEKWTKSKGDWKQELADKMRRGEISATEVLEQALLGIAGGSDEVRKQARRKRIRRLYRETGKDVGSEEEFNKLMESLEEKSVLEALGEARQVASMEIDSEYDEDEDEDEDGDDEDGEEGGSDEDDEWEDASDDEEEVEEEDE